MDLSFNACLASSDNTKKEHNQEREHGSFVLSGQVIRVVSPREPCRVWAKKDCADIGLGKPGSSVISGDIVAHNDLPTQKFGMPVVVSASTPMVAEGVRNSLAIQRISRQAKVEMPITDQMVEVLYNGKDPSRSVKDLMSRELRSEAEL